MNHLTRHKIKTTATLIILSLGSIALWTKAQAVSPPPDGGYPGGNTAEGQNALLSLTTGGFNTAVGFFSLRSNTTGSFNTAIGAGALLANIADRNTATGVGALLSNTTGIHNTANGAFALFNNINTDQNTATGDSALFQNTTGAANTATGYLALFSNTTGNNNSAFGSGALGLNTTGSENIALGFNSGVNVTTAGGVIAIGNSGANVSNSCFIGRIRGVTTANADAIPVLIDSAGQLGTASSSRRFKHDIAAMDKASEAILALKPVTFHYTSDKTKRPEFGLIAEEVGEVNPDLVVRNQNGEIYTVRYDAVNAMLLNEFLKEHRKVEEQQAAILELKSVVAQQQKEFQAAIADQRREFENRLQQQDARIQTVSDRIEWNKVVPQMAANN